MASGKNRSRTWLRRRLRCRRRGSRIWSSGGCRFTPRVTTTPARFRSGLVSQCVF